MRQKWSNCSEVVVDAPGETSEQNKSPVSLNLLYRFEEWLQTSLGTASYVQMFYPVEITWSHSQLPTE